jgi:organic radical activating enzyme
VPTNDSWKHAAEVAAIARQYPPVWALVTGGEPTWHNLTELTRALRDVGLYKALETSGVYRITGLWEWITISPKPDGLLNILGSELCLADEIKWVVGNRAQLERVERIMDVWLRDNLLAEKTRVSLQPMSTNKKATDLCMEALMKHPRWKLSLQTHKMTGIA